jgi:hypothetical protein
MYRRARHFCSIVPIEKYTPAPAGLYEQVSLSQGPLFRYAAGAVQSLGLRAMRSRVFPGWHRFRPGNYCADRRRR